MTPVPACTIASHHSLAHARVLAESYEEHHPGARVYVCLVDRPDPEVSYGDLPFVVIFAHELSIPVFENFAFRYDAAELEAAVKPSFLAHLRDRVGLDRVFYFDPDVLIQDRLVRLAQDLERHEALLTPHISAPLDSRQRPRERLIRMSGVYNLGFLGLRLNESTAPFLDWWQERLDRYCVSDVQMGLFVDQSWMDFALAFLPSVKVVRDPVYNVAHWNLEQRRPQRSGDRWEVDGRAVAFFHFRGVHGDEGRGVRNERAGLTLGAKGGSVELEPLLEHYRTRLDERSPTPGEGVYGFATFRDASIAIPPVARRVLRRVDPHGKRWPDPFEMRCRDSFFSWLVEPLELERGYLNRCVLALWEERNDLIRAFPDPCGTHLEGYISWLTDDGGAAEAGLGNALLASVRRKPVPTRPRRTAVTAAIYPYDATIADLAAEMLATIDLRRPGAMVPWLNEPVPGTAQRRPVLTRLALLLHRIRPDLQRDYPDPLEADQHDYAYWFSRFGGREFELNPILVAPVERSLPREQRMRGALRKVREAFVPWWSYVSSQTGSVSLGSGRGQKGSAGAGDVALDTLEQKAGQSPGPDETPSREEEARGWGVNLTGYFGMDTGVGQMVRGSSRALRRAGISQVQIALDEDPFGKLIEGRLHQTEGAPYPVSLVHANADETPRALSTLPLASKVGSYKIGYWFWELSHFPLGLADRFGYLDEIWAPSRFCLAAYEALSSVPVRYVPPCVPRPRGGAIERRRLGMEDGRFYFFFAFDVLSVPERKNPFAAIEALKRLTEVTTRHVGLFLKVSRARQAPDLLGRLREAASGLPVVIYTKPASRAEVEGMLESCDGILSLHRSEGLGLLVIEGLYLAKPVVATGYGGLTDFFDEEVGYPVAYDLCRLDRAYPPYPAGAVWAEPIVDDAVERMRTVVERPENAHPRAIAGRERVVDLYGERAAGQRFRRELERLLEKSGG